MKLGWAWTVLFALLGLLLAGALLIDRSTWPSLVGDEATYLMQAESLAWDLDLSYTRTDYERFLARRAQKPEGLILQSGDGGRSITYGKPFFYALYLAPFVRLAPQRGARIANALLLALAACCAAHTLERRIGAAAPLFVALLVFGSVSFVYTFWTHPDLFLMCLAALALSLVLAPAPAHGSGDGRTVVRFAVAGALLAVLAASRPMYAVLFLPAALAAPRPCWRRAWPALLGGGAAVLVTAGLVHQSLSGSWTSYGAARRGFYSYTGFPEVDFPASEWRTNLEDWGNHAWLRPGDVAQKKIVPSLVAWNSLYFLAGRHVGLLPYFLPLLLAFAGRVRGAFSWALLLAFALGAAAFLWLRPFNFWGGGGAVANRYILPLYPLFWFLPQRPIPPRWILVAAALSALFMAPLWRAPGAFPLLRGGAYGYVSEVAKRWLPYESTQSHLKPSGQEDVLHHGLWIKFLDRGVGAVREGELLQLRDGGGALLVGSPRPIATLELEVRGAGRAHLALRGGRMRELEPRHRSRRWHIELGAVRARHPMWWTWEPFYLYRLELVATPPSAKPLPFRLRAP